jgi:predicted ATPase
VFQLAHPLLLSEFPPIQSLDSFPNNLPVQLTSFIGRKGELAEAKKKLSITRLLTFIGSGGTGKTRLSLHLAADLLTSFTDGIWFVELAPLTEPNLILQTIASVFGVREQMGTPLMEVLLNYLRVKQILLILDSCEHLIEACAKLADQFLHACPNMKIIASSREALGINGETVYRVPSLSLPDQVQINYEELVQFEAVQLFVERAVAANPKFNLTEKNAFFIAQICRRLDGIPLALELAAARITIFSPEQIASRLDDRFKLLTGGSRTALPRQQTLRAMIDWSYEILSDPERALMCRLSVFAGSWTFEAAETIFSDLDILTILTLLVNKSLVVVENESAETRYRLLETIRQYSRDKLVETGELEKTRRMHLEYFVGFAEASETKMDGVEVFEWLPRLEADYDNFRSALEWGLDNEVEAALRMVSALAAFWFRRGHTVEGINWIREALDRVEKIPKLEGKAAHQQRLVQAKAWQAMASLAYLNDNPTALKASEACIALARQLGDNHLLAISLAVAGSVKILLDDPAGAFTALEESLRIAHTSGEKYSLGIALTMMAHYNSIVKRDFIAAWANEEAGLALLSDNETSWGTVNAVLGSARNAIMRDDYATARARFIKSLPTFQQMGDEHRVNMIQSELAHMERHEGHPLQAEAAYRKTILVWQKLGHRSAIAHQLESFGFVAKMQQQQQRAARLFAAAEVLREKIGIPMNPEEYIEYSGEVTHLRANMDEKIFASVWAEGRAMTLEQAVAYAIDEKNA